MVGYFVTHGNVVVQFVSTKVSKPARAVCYGISVPLLAGLYSGRPEIFGPFCLALHEEVTSSLVYGTDGPYNIHLKDLWNSVELKASLAGNMGSNGIADMVSGRGVGFEHAMKI